MHETSNTRNIIVPKLYQNDVICGLGVLHEHPEVPGQRQRAAPPAGRLHQRLLRPQGADGGSRRGRRAHNPGRADGESRRGHRYIKTQVTTQVRQMEALLEAIEISLNLYFFCFLFFSLFILWHLYICSLIRQGSVTDDQCSFNRNG